MNDKAILKLEFEPKHGRIMLAMAMNVPTQSLDKYSDQEVLVECLKYICEPYAIENVMLLSYDHKGYDPMCPRGYTDCVNDPAYIQYTSPEYYKELYGDKSPYEAAEECRKSVEEDPDEKYYCYDDEDK